MRPKQKEQGVKIPFNKQGEVQRRKPTEKPTARHAGGFIPALFSRVETGETEMQEHIALKKDTEIKKEKFK